MAIVKIRELIGTSEKNFEDALQNYSAEQNGTINSIITRNTKDYKKSKIGVLTPEDFLKTNLSKK